MKIDFSDRFRLMMLVGNSGAGKSHMAQYLAYCLHSLGLVDGALVFTGTQFSKEAAAYHYIDPRYVTAFSNKLLATFVEKVRKDLDRGIEKKYLIIFDDIGGDRAKFDSGGVFIKFMTTYRHLKCNIINICQSATQFPPQIRDNSSIVFIFPPVLGRNEGYVYNLAGTKLSKQEFRDLLERVARVKYQVLVYNSLEPQHYYGMMKAPAEIPDFELNL